MREASQCQQIHCVPSRCCSKTWGNVLFCYTLILYGHSKAHPTWSSHTRNACICGHVKSNEWAWCCLWGSGLNGGWASMTLERSNHILLDQVPHTGHTEGSCWARLVGTPRWSHKKETLESPSDAFPTTSVSRQGVGSHGCLPSRYMLDCHLFRTKWVSLVICIILDCFYLFNGLAHYVCCLTCACDQWKFLILQVHSPIKSITIASTRYIFFSQLMCKWKRELQCWQ